MSTVIRGAVWPRFALAALMGLVLLLAGGIEVPGAIAQEETDLDGGLAPGSAAIVVDAALLRDAPDFGAVVLTPLDPGTPADVVGGSITDLSGTRWWLVTSVGQTGYLPVGALVPVDGPTEVAPEPPPVEAPAMEAPVESADAAPEADPEAVPEGVAESDSMPVDAAPDPIAQPFPDPPVATPTAATATDLVNLRAGPSYDDEVLRVLPPGAPMTVTGVAQAGFLPVVYDGTAGWVDAAYLDTTGGAFAPAEPTPDAVPDPALDPAAETFSAALATATEPLNLRLGPATDAPVVVVIPAGAVLETNGAPEAGFYPVGFEGQTGWANADYLDFDADPLDPTVTAPTVPDANLDAGVDVEDNSEDDAEAEDEAAPAVPEIAAPPSGGAGIVFPFSGGTWQVIQGYNNGTHTYRGAMSDYRYSLDWARADGNTAGQPIYAPVSGTVVWTSNGGMLIDAGNGYGVAMFHVTFDGFSSGQSVQQGQPLGVISGPGGPGYAGTPHVDLTLWQLGGGANVSTPFSGPNAIAGRDFPDGGSANQHMGVTVTP